MKDHSRKTETSFFHSYNFLDLRARPIAFGGLSMHTGPCLRRFLPYLSQISISLCKNHSRMLTLCIKTPCQCGANFSPISATKNGYQEQLHVSPMLNSHTLPLFLSLLRSHFLSLPPLQQTQHPPFLRCPLHHSNSL